MDGLAAQERILIENHGPDGRLKEREVLILGPDGQRVAGEWDPSISTALNDNQKGAQTDDR